MMERTILSFLVNICHSEIILLQQFLLSNSFQDPPWCPEQVEGDELNKVMIPFKENLKLKTKCNEE